MPNAKLNFKQAIYSKLGFRIINGKEFLPLILHIRILAMLVKPILYGAIVLVLYDAMTYQPNTFFGMMALMYVERVYDTCSGWNII